MVAEHQREQRAHYRRLARSHDHLVYAALARARRLRKLADELRLLPTQQQVEGVLEGEVPRVEGVGALTRGGADHIAAPRGDLVSEGGAALRERLARLVRRRLAERRRTGRGRGERAQLLDEAMREGEGTARVADARGGELDGGDEVLELGDARFVKRWIEQLEDRVAAGAHVEGHEHLKGDRRLPPRPARDGRVGTSSVGELLRVAHAAQERSTVLLDKRTELVDHLDDGARGRGCFGAIRLPHDRGGFPSSEARELRHLGLAGVLRVVSEVLSQPLDHALRHRVGHAAARRRRQRRSHICT